MARKTGTAAAFFALAVLVPLGACVRASDAYRDGWSQGCDKGYWDAGRTIGPHPSEDRARAAADPDYRSGWEAGYRQCYDLQYLPEYFGPP